MPENAVTTKTLRSLRMEKKEIDALLESIDALTHAPAKEQRQSERYTYRTNVIAYLQQPGSAHRLGFRVPTRNLCKGGLSFLHGGFLHIGTECTVQLMTPQGTWCDAVGTVLRCRYLEGHVHEIAIKFDNEIDPALFCASAVRPRILLVEDSPTGARLALFYLKKLNAECEHVNLGRKAIEMAMKAPYDIILLDIDMPDIDGFEVAKTLRQQGYCGTIVAATGLTEPADRVRCLDAGCDRYIPKPYGEKALAEMIEGVGEEPIYSSFCNDHSMAELVGYFLSTLPARIAELETSLMARETKKLQHVVRELKAEGAGYGFEILSDKAAELENLLIQEPQIEAAEIGIKELVKMCLRVRTSTRVP